MSDSSPTIYKLRELLKELGIEPPTFYDWKDAGVCQISKQRFYEGRSRKSRGREADAISPEQLERLKKFLRYRQCLLLPRAQIIDIVVLLDLEDEEDLKEAIRQLESYEQSLKDDLEAVQLEIFRLHARLHGDEAIDPEQDDLEQ